MSNIDVELVADFIEKVREHFKAQVDNILILDKDIALKCLDTAIMRTGNELVRNAVNDLGNIVNKLREDLSK